MIFAKGTARFIVDMDIIESVIKEFSFKKELGQNFIFNDRILERIATLGGCEDAFVVEIGAGVGTLTYHLCEKAAFVAAFEVDSEALEVIGDFICYCNNVKVYDDNILKLGHNYLDEVVAHKSPYRIISNLPFYCSSALIHTFIQSKYVTDITVLVQKEFAERICNQSGSDSRALSLIVHSIFTTQILMEVSRTDFYPQPNVDAALLKLQRISGKFYDKKVDNFFKTVSANKRKTLANNLISYYNVSRESLANVLAQLQLSPTVRAESLDANTLLKIANGLNIL